jgi:hypothetical protein
MESAKSSSVPKSSSRPRHVVASLALTFGLGASLAAQDPFTTAENPFASGWKQVTSVPTTGVFANKDGRSVVAWGPQGAQISNDRGVSWSNPVVPGAFTGSANTPVISGGVGIAEAVIAGNEAYIRTYDGVVRGVDGSPRNQLWNVQAVSRLAVSGNGTLFAEQADGKTTIAVRNGAKIGEAPGRLVFAFENAAATFDGKSAYHFDGQQSKAIPIRSIDGRPPAGYPVQTGPGTSVQRANDASRWILSNKELVCETRAPEPTQILSYGPGASKQDGVLIGVLHSAKAGGTVIVSARERDGLRRNEASEGSPPDLTAVAGLGQDPNGIGRFRLLAATCPLIQPV